MLQYFIMNIKNIKNCALMLGLSVALSAIPTFAAQESNDSDVSREQLLGEAISLLDKVELSSPRSQADIMRVRERLIKLQNIDNGIDPEAGDDPELMFSQSGSTTAYSRANKANTEAFYRSCRGKEGGSLRGMLQSQVSKMKGVDYGKARELIMLKIDNHGGNVECVYTGKVTKVKDKMPSSNSLNIEHTWPQSMGAVGPAKSDLHHLFPTDSKANSYRSSLPFGVCDDKYIKFDVGGSRCDGSVFEVRKQHRGNVARAMFYFAVRYNKSIDAKEEAVLRQWHKDDPVDPCERARNDAIEAIQKNRNPFIDHPEYVDQITNF